MRIGVIGASGAVGREIVRLLEERVSSRVELLCFASPQSKGKTLPFRGESIPLEPLSLSHLRTLDLAFFAAGSAVSREWIPKRGSTLVIDSSSAFRMEPHVPLVIPEINAHALTSHEGLIASPNCTTTVLLMPLAPLHARFRVKRIVAASYQAASGGGRALLDLLEAETRGERPVSPLPFPYAWNVYPHNSPLHPSGYVEEERKMVFETRKILEDDAIGVSATCVRVPVKRAHSIAANCEFYQEPVDIASIWDATSGLKRFENPSENRFATPFDVSGREEVFVGRLRKDLTQERTIEFWAVGDQLLKGAALNAVQIASKISESIRSS